jgi:hypothetical protein
LTVSSSEPELRSITSCARGGASTTDPRASRDASARGREASRQGGLRKARTWGNYAAQRSSFARGDHWSAGDGAARVERGAIRARSDGAGGGREATSAPRERRVVTNSKRRAPRGRRTNGCDGSRGDTRPARTTSDAQQVPNDRTARDGARGRGGWASHLREEDVRARARRGLRVAEDLDRAADLARRHRRDALRAERLVERLR